MSEEQSGPTADLSQDQHGWVRAYRYGMRLGDIRPFYLDAHSDPREAEEDIQRRVVKAQLDLLLRFTGASYFDVDPDPDSWLDTFYVLAGTWNGRDAVIDEQLASIDQVLSQTGGPLWRPDLYLPLGEVHQAAVVTVPASPQAAPSISASSWREPPRLIDWTPDEDPAAGYLRELRDSRKQARESGVSEHSVDAPAVDSSSRFAELARKLTRRTLRPRSNRAHHEAHQPHRSVSSDGMHL